jgi:hypothetical protein
MTRSVEQPLVWSQHRIERRTPLRCYIIRDAANASEFNVVLDRRTLLRLGARIRATTACGSCVPIQLSIVLEHKRFDVRVADVALLFALTA